MKEKTFKIGQKVVCINEDGWISGWTESVSNGPYFEETVTVRGYDGVGLLFDEYEGDEGYSPDQFVPIIDDDITKDLAKFNGVEERLDIARIKEIEPISGW